LGKAGSQELESAVALSEFIRVEPIFERPLAVWKHKLLIPDPELIESPDYGTQLLSAIRRSVIRLII
jgi:hypothetical protein